MMKEKRKVLTLLAAAALAVSVPGNSADVQASSNTFRVNVATGYLALTFASTASNPLTIGIHLNHGTSIDSLQMTGFSYSVS